MSEGIDIEVMGHKGKITRLLPTIRAFPGILDPEEDLISAWVEFEPPVDGIAGMFVNIPLAVYTRGVLTQVVVKAVEKSFATDERIKAQREKRQAREKHLEALVEGVKKAVGLGCEEPPIHYAATISSPKERGWERLWYILHRFLHVNFSSTLFIGRKEK